MSRVWAGMLAFAIVLAGCGTRTTSVRIPPGYTDARSATHRNLAADKPQLLNELRAAWEQYSKEVGIVLPQR